MPQPASDTHPIDAQPVQRYALPVGVVLHGVRAGQGEALVFVHGVMGDWRSWAPQWPAFTPHFDCVSYSRRYNHPNTNAMDSPRHSALVEAQDLLGLMDVLGLGQAHLVASSYGAFTALALAVEHPQRVRSIVAVEPAMMCYAQFSLQGQDEWERFRRTVVAPANTAFRSGDDERGAQIMTGGIHAAGASATAGPELQRRLQNARAMRMLALSEDEFPLLARDQLAGLPMPILLLSGSRTPPIHAAVFRNVCAAMPQAQHAWVAEAGHGVARDQPAAFNALALEFLGITPASGTADATATRVGCAAA